MDRKPPYGQSKNVFTQTTRISTRSLNRWRWCMELATCWRKWYSFPVWSIIRQKVGTNSKPFSIFCAHLSINVLNYRWHTLIINRLSINFEFSPTFIHFFCYSVMERKLDRLVIEGFDFFLVGSHDRWLERIPQEHDFKHHFMRFLWYRFQK